MKKAFGSTDLISTGVEMMQFKDALKERVKGVAGLFQVYVEVFPEEVRVVSVLEQDGFDETVENQIYDIHYDFLDRFDLPMRFLCLPRSVIHTVAPSRGAELIFSK